MKYLFFGFLCVRRVHERAFWMSLKPRTKKKNHKIFKIKRGTVIWNSFSLKSMEPNTALELVKQGVTLLLLDVPQYTLLGIDTQVLLLILYSTSFFCLLLLIFIHQSIDQCGRCFLLGLLLRASRWFLLLLIFFIIVHPPGYFNFQKSLCSCNFVIVFLCDFCL